MSQIYNPLTGQKFNVGQAATATSDAPGSDVKLPLGDLGTDRNKLKLIGTAIGITLFAGAFLSIAMIHASASDKEELSREIVQAPEVSEIQTSDDDIAYSFFGNFFCRGAKRSRFCD